MLEKDTSSINKNISKTVNSRNTKKTKRDRKPKLSKNRRFLEATIDRSGVVELAIHGINGKFPLLDGGTTERAVAWCDNTDAVFKIIKDLRYHQVDYTNVFMTFNEPKKQVYGDVKLNRLYRSQDTKGSFYKDIRMLRYNYLFVDVDPATTVRPVTDEITKKCVEACKKIRKDLKVLGFPDPFGETTGNGAALFFPLDGFRNNKHVRGQFKRLYKYLTKFSTGDVKIDTSVGNPSRYCRVPGTANCKEVGEGADTFQYCRVVHCPAKVEPLSLDSFNRIVNQICDEEDDSEVKVDLDKPRTDSLDLNILDVEKYLDNYNIPIAKVKKQGSSTLYCLDNCAFNRDHSGNESSIGQQKNGKLFYQCFHTSCIGKSWHDFRQLISGDDSLKPYLKGYQIDYESNSLELSDVSVIPLGEILARKYKSTPLIKNLVDENESVIIGGPAGVGKSAITVLLSLLGATPPRRNLFDLFEFPRSFATLFVQSEVTGRHIQTRCKLLIKYWPNLKKGLSKIQYLGRGDSCRLTAKFSDPSFQKILIKTIVEANVGLVIIDPLISYIDGVGENENSGMRKELDCLKRACEHAGASVVLVHHTGKDGRGLRGASSINGWADRIVLLEPVVKNGEECFKFVFDKTRNQEKLAPILVKKTGLRFERIASSSEDEMDMVVAALQGLPGGIAEKQITLLDKIVETSGVSRSTARRKVEAAVRDGLIVEHREGQAKGYKLPIKTDDD